MISYKLNIAGYRILFQARSESVSLAPSGSQQSFISGDESYDIAVNIICAGVRIYPGAIKVFEAPYVEEINGEKVKKSDKFWTVYKHGEYILVHTTMPLSESVNEAMLVIRPGEKGWDLIIDSTKSKINPMEYPIDGLLLYYLTAIKGDIFIHGSGLLHNGYGYLFSGPSGRGKTTIADLFKQAGAEIVHDDRLIIRRHHESYKMYNTPVYENEISRSAPLHGIFIISHGTTNELSNPGSVASFTSVMTNCIQHHWNTLLVERLTGAIMDLTSSIPVKNLSFLPGLSVVRFIENEQNK